MVSNSHYGRVIAGWDGRWQSQHLLDVAATQAIRRHRPLSIVTLVHAPDEVASTEGHPPDGWQAKGTAGHSLEAAAHALGERFEDLRIATHCLWFSEVEPDLEPFASAVLLVIGERDRHGNPAFGSGSASRRIRAVTACDVIEVPVDEVPVDESSPEPLVLDREILVRGES
jgi:hypothetical protein